MFNFNRMTRVCVSKEPTVMRSSYDTLFEKVKKVLNQSPFSWHLFLFINKSRTSIKSIYYDGMGFVIIAKRLERGVFSRINPFYKRKIILAAAEFSLYFKGANLEKRFIEIPSGINKN